MKFAFSHARIFEQFFESASSYPMKFAFWQCGILSAFCVQFFESASSHPAKFAFSQCCISIAFVQFFEGCVMVEEAKCEDVGKIRNNLFVEGCVGLLSWLCVCLARRFFCG